MQQKRSVFGRRLEAWLVAFQQKWSDNAVPFKMRQNVKAPVLATVITAMLRSHNTCFGQGIGLDIDSSSLDFRRSCSGGPKGDFHLRACFEGRLPIACSHAHRGVATLQIQVRRAAGLHSSIALGG